nr:hypothetical protein [Tanacetum cinerariifolium]
MPANRSGSLCQRSNLPSSAKPSPSALCSATARSSATLSPDRRLWLIRAARSPWVEGGEHHSYPCASGSLSGVGTVEGEDRGDVAPAQRGSVPVGQPRNAVSGVSRALCAGAFAGSLAGGR